MKKIAVLVGVIFLLNEFYDLYEIIKEKKSKEKKMKKMKEKKEKKERPGRSGRSCDRCGEGALYGYMWSGEFICDECMDTDSGVGGILRDQEERANDPFAW